MKLLDNPRLFGEKGFTLVEVMVAVAITIVVMAAVFGLLYQGQDSFVREREVTDVNQSARAGIASLSRDLTMAGFKTPPALAVLVNDGGGTNPPNPDQVTLLYEDPAYPTARTLDCLRWPGPCDTIQNSSTLFLDSGRFDPPQANPAQAYRRGQVLFAIETEDCNGDGQNGIIPFMLTQDPAEQANQNRVRLNHNPGQGSMGWNPPGGFNRQLNADCTMVGVFRAIQYRINPPPPTPNPNLERRDLSLGAAAAWIPVANNIENLQIQYATGNNPNFVDAPPAPNQDDPLTWITQVKVTVAGRSESTNLQGGSPGVFASTDTHLRRTFSTTVSLRNIVNEVANAQPTTP